MSDIEGGCACGAIRFKIQGEPMGGGVCHCRSCQYATGGPPNYVLLAPKGGFSVTKGQPKVHTTTAESGNRVDRAFCPECGTPLYTAIDGDTLPFIPVKVGALDDPSNFTPGMHLFMDEAQPWHLVHPGAMQFPRMPPAPPTAG